MPSAPKPKPGLEGRRQGQPQSQSTAKQLAYRRGRRAERLALCFLRLKGYRLVAKGYKKPVGEIDLILKRGGLLVFVEVKQRASYSQAAEAITPRQQKRIQQAAQAFLQEHPALAHKTMRFDAVLFSAGSWPRHVTDAWRG